MAMRLDRHPAAMMVGCRNHPAAPPAGVCFRCADLYCAVCLQELDGHIYCPNCRKALDTPAPPLPEAPASKGSATATTDKTDEGNKADTADDDPFDVKILRAVIPCPVAQDAKWWAFMGALSMLCLRLPLYTYDPALQQLHRMDLYGVLRLAPFIFCWMAVGKAFQGKRLIRMDGFMTGAGGLNLALWLSIPTLLIYISLVVSDALQWYHAYRVVDYPVWFSITGATAISLLILVITALQYYLTPAAKEKLEE
ncbi:MAG: hypothetical protein ACYDBB_21995 [Armatimonadota bacterium]